MSDDTKVPVPSDERLYIFSLFLRLFRLPIFRNVKNAICLFLFSISPNVPVLLTNVMRRPPAKRAFWSGVILGWVFCLGGTILLAVLDGTLIGTDPNRIYLLRDWPNLVNYILICPLYLGFSVQLIVIVLYGWPTLVSIPLNSIEKFALPRRAIGFTIFLILSISLGFTLNYIHESINPSVYLKVGWWVAQVGAGDERILGLIGTYYAILNFVLLAICLTALLSFLSLFFACIRVGRALEVESVSNVLTFKGLRTSLQSFTEAYLTVKLLTATLMLNAYTWKFERPEASFNMKGLGLVLAIFGVFIFSIPRYYIELEWFKFKIRRALALGEFSDDIVKEDIRPFRTRLIVHVIDVLIISGFILTFFTWNP